jgi:phospholipid/cholesterol/gamma-HCH transport system substrate-binding protein
MILRTDVMDRKGLELSVGVFLLIGLLCLAYLSIRLGDLHLFGGSDYLVEAAFSNVAGLKEKGAVTMAGVNIGQVERIELQDGRALVKMRINQGVKLEQDVIASIKTMGIIGDKYISISPGADDEYIPSGGAIQDTQPPLDIENLLGKFVFGSVDNNKSSGQKESGRDKQ